MFRLVLEVKAGKKITELSRFAFLEKLLRILKEVF